MSISSQISITLDLDRARAADARIIIIHPHTKHRGLLTSIFAEKFDDNLHYYAAKDDRVTLVDFVRNLVDQFAKIYENFGDKTKSKLKGGDPAALGKALAADLAALGGSFGLILDELDRARVADGFIAFFNAIAEAMPDGSQLILLTRQLPHHPWKSLVLSDNTVVLDDYGHPVETEGGLPLLEVYALGAGNALINGEPILSWDGALPRNLFFFFVDRPLVTRDEVFATFWPDLSVKEATNVFHVTKRKISERLDHELTSYNSGFYIPSGQMQVYYDSVDFLESIEQASTMSDEEATKKYRHAIDLYRGDFLSGLKMEWAIERRQALKGAYAQALIALGRIRKSQGHNEEALGYFLRALHETPEREDIHREVMSLYAAMGRNEDAKAQYRRLAAELEADLGITPSRESRELYESIS